MLCGRWEHTDETDQHIKSAACYALGYVDRHYAKHSKEFSDSNVLSLMSYYYMVHNSSDDLK